MGGESTMKRILFLTCLAVASIGSALGTPLSNIVLNKPVTLVGAFGYPDNSIPLASPTTLVDGLFLAGGTAWQDGTVWWDSTLPDSGNNSIIINLLTPYTISGFIAQADDNDIYQVDYWNGSQWLSAWTIPTNLYGGLRVRPNDTDYTEIYMIPTPITTAQLRITGVGGDSYYGISELQAWGTTPVGVVPEPSTFLLIGGGLVAVALRFRRKRA